MADHDATRRPTRSIFSAGPINIPVSQADDAPEPEPKPATDPVNHPSHYTSHPSGIEAIQVTEHMGFCIGNAMKYLWRADLKADAIEDLRKARWYIEREIQRRMK